MDRPEKRERLRQAERMLAEAGSLLASSLEYEETLAGVARLIVQSLADFCVIDVVENGDVRRLQVAHTDPALAELTQELLRFPLDRGRPHLSLTALETGKAVLLADVTDEVVDSLAQSPEHRRIIEALTPRSFMAVPMRAREHLLGVILFVSSGRNYDAADLEVAEKLVHLAALDVDNARLYREAQRALDARDRVLGIVAHDLRNPLNVISMSAELLLDESFSPSQRVQQAQMILRSAKGMNRLIQDLLDVARIEADQLILHREAQAPRRLALEAIELNVALAVARDLTLRLEPSAHLPLVSADHDRILQVLANLIGNAIKFTPKGGRIDVRLEKVDGAVRFAVADTGPGIPPADLPHVFQSFWQARRASVEGAGLGLMIARGIVEAHGGRIWVESEPGRGSTFFFTVPAMTRAARERRRGADRRSDRGPGAAGA